MKIYKFIIDDQTRVEQHIPGREPFVWSSCLGVALAESLEQAKEILRAKHKEADAMDEWLDFAEVIEIPLDTPACIAISQG